MSTRFVIIERVVDLEKSLVGKKKMQYNMVIIYINNRAAPKFKERKKKKIAPRTNNFFLQAPIWRTNKTATGVGSVYKFDL